VEDTILFPLDAGHGESAAETPTVGSSLLDLFPSQQATITVVLVSVIIGVVALLLVSGRGGSMSQACARAAGAFLVASALAPAARVGYLVYQLNLIAWAVVSDRHARAPTRTRRGLPFRTRVHDA
jgi:hypothetical protein